MVIAAPAVVVLVVRVVLLIISVFIVRGRGVYGWGTLGWRYVCGFDEKSCLSLDICAEKEWNKTRSSFLWLCDQNSCRGCGVLQEKQLLH